MMKYYRMFFRADGGILPEEIAGWAHAFIERSEGGGNLQ